MIEHFEVLVEDLSTEAALRILIPRIVPEVTFDLHAHRGKNDLLGKLPGRLRGYEKWLPSSAAVVIVMDSDSQPPAHVRSEIEAIASAAGFETRLEQHGRHAVARLAVQELESWFFGDWEAVVDAFPGVSENVVRRAAYRVPDEISSTWEALERVLQQGGYFRGGIRKVELASDVASHMDPNRNTSASFQELRVTLLRLAS